MCRLLPKDEEHHRRKSSLLQGPDKETIYACDVPHLLEAIDTLPPEDLEIITGLYGIDTEPVSQIELARQLGIPRASLQRRIKKILEGLHLELS